MVDSPNFPKGNFLTSYPISFMVWSISLVSNIKSINRMMAGSNLL